MASTFRALRRSLNKLCPRVAKPQAKHTLLLAHAGCYKRYRSTLCAAVRQGMHVIDADFVLAVAVPVACDRNPSPALAQGVIRGVARVEFWLPLRVDDPLPSRKTPISSMPSPLKSPTTGRSPFWPK